MTTTHEQATTKGVDHENALASFRQMATSAMGLPAEDKADILDLILDLFLNFPNQSPEQVGNSMQLMYEITTGHRENTKLVEMPLTHDDEDESGPKQYPKWKNWIAEKVRDLRKKKKWTQEDLAAKSDLPQSHISRIERAVHSPSRQTVKKLAKAFGIDVGKLDPHEEVGD